MVTSLSIPCFIDVAYYFRKVFNEDSREVSPGGATCNMTFNQTDIYESVNIIQCLRNFPYVFQIMKYEGLPSVPVILRHHH